MILQYSRKWPHENKLAQQIIGVLQYKIIQVYAWKWYLNPLPLIYNFILLRFYSWEHKDTQIK